MVVVLRVRVLYVEVIAAGLDLLGRDLPGELVLLAVRLPRLLPLEELDADGPGLRVVLVALG